MRAILTPKPTPTGTAQNRNQNTAHSDMVGLVAMSGIESNANPATTKDQTSSVPLDGACPRRSIIDDKPQGPHNTRAQLQRPPSTTAPMIGWKRGHTSRPLSVAARCSTALRHPSYSSDSVGSDLVCTMR